MDNLYQIGASLPHELYFQARERHRRSCKKIMKIFPWRQKVSETCSRVLYRLQFDRKSIPRAKIRRSYAAVVHQSRISRRERLGWSLERSWRRWAAAELPEAPGAAQSGSGESWILEPGIWKLSLGTVCGSRWVRGLHNRLVGCSGDDFFSK